MISSSSVDKNKIWLQLLMREIISFVLTVASLATVMQIVMMSLGRGERGADLDYRKLRHHCSSIISKTNHHNKMDTTSSSRNITRMTLLRRGD